MFDELKTKATFNSSDIQSIIDNRLEESINIEFKSSGSLTSNDSKKKEIAKDISAFANSDGGIIFYGIDEENHVASKLSFIDGNIITKEWLENVITSRIQQKIEGLKIIPVRFENNISKSVYVVIIPRSTNSPHITCDKKYYKRYNFMSIPMEEYEVRNLYFQQREGIVDIDVVNVKLAGDKNDDYTFNFIINVSNQSNFIAEKYRIACNIKSFYGTQINAKENYSITQKDNTVYKISTRGNLPIFPKEVLNVLDFNIVIPKKLFEEKIKEFEMCFYIFMVGNTYEYKYNAEKNMRQCIQLMEQKFLE